MVRDLAPAECAFAYRTSAFKRSDRHVVLAVTFRLRRVAGLGAGALRRAGPRPRHRPGQRAPLAAVRAAVLALRAGKGMVLDPADPDTYSAGSFFMNPVLDPAAFAVLRQRALDTVGAEPVAWPAESARPRSARPG